MNIVEFYTLRHVLVGALARVLPRRHRSPWLAALLPYVEVLPLARTPHDLARSSGPTCSYVAP